MTLIYGMRLTGTQSGGQTENIIHVRNQDGFTYTKSQFIDNIFERFIGQLVGLQANNYTWTKMSIWEWYNENDTPLEVAISQGGTSGSAIQYFNSMAAVFQKKTAVSGKTGRGRFYMAAPPGTNLVNGKWSTSYTTNLEAVRTAINAWLTGARPLAHINLVLVPRSSDSEEYKDVTDFKPRDYPGTQVRRNFFRGA